MKKLHLSLAMLVVPMSMACKSDFSYDIAQAQATAVQKAQEAKNQLLQASFSVRENAAKLAFFQEELKSLEGKLATAADKDKAGITAGIDSLKKEIEVIAQASTGFKNTASGMYQKLTSTVVQYPSAAIATVVALFATVLVLLNNSDAANVVDDIENF